MEKVMRIVHELQKDMGRISVEDIQINPKSRDDIPQILLGLQHIYTTPTLKKDVFSILAELRPASKSNPAELSNPDNGRPGMDQWKILVLGALRLGLNTDYDRICELANEHNTIRQMLGHGGWEDPSSYELQTIKDNLGLFTSEVLDRINQIVVKAGHTLLKKSPETELSGRCDSFVVETNVHFPTDINLLYDAIRKMIENCLMLSGIFFLSDWRQNNYQLKKFKKLYRKIQKLKHSTSKDEKKRKAKEKEIERAYQTYLDMAEKLVKKAKQTRQNIEEYMERKKELPKEEFIQLNSYLSHAERQIDQIRRRVLKGENIPHNEKVFSIFQPHTEWISKGKAGVPVELGLRVCVMEDQHRFILHHQVMENKTDDSVAIDIVKESQTRFSNLNVVSMDKGFHSPDNQKELREMLDRIVLPKKGRLSEADKEREYAEEFIQVRHQHSAVESAINALEVHGLDKCPDQGITGFKRYVALAVVARNIHRLGAIIREQQNNKRKRNLLKQAA